jgi:hypothetical protein
MRGKKMGASRITTTTSVIAPAAMSIHIGTPQKCNGGHVFYARAQEKATRQTCAEVWLSALRGSILREPRSCGPQTPLPTGASLRRTATTRSDRRDRSLLRGRFSLVRSVDVFFRQQQPEFCRRQPSLDSWRRHNRARSWCCRLSRHSATRALGRSRPCRQVLMLPARSSSSARMGTPRLQA